MQADLTAERARELEAAEAGVIHSYEQMQQLERLQLILECRAEKLQQACLVEEHNREVSALERDLEHWRHEYSKLKVNQVQWCCEQLTLLSAKLQSQKVTPPSIKGNEGSLWLLFTVTAYLLFALYIF